MFEKILVPIDGSQHAEYAVQTAVMIAEKFRSRITLLHVSALATSLPLDKFSQTSAITQEDIVKLIASTREAGFTILEQAQHHVEHAGIPVKTLFKEGHIVQTIINTAKDGRFDLIVLGAHGISHVVDHPLGSVSEKVVRLAPCTVMVIKYPDDFEPNS